MTNTWKGHTFSLESKFKQLDAYYADLATRLSHKNAVLQSCLTLAHNALTQVLADTDLASAQTTASNAVAAMHEHLEKGGQP